MLALVRVDPTSEVHLEDGGVGRVMCNMHSGAGEYTLLLEYGLSMLKFWVPAL